MVSDDNVSDEDGKGKDNHNTSNQQDNEDDYQVHLVQTLLTVNEVFVYRIPPMKTSGGHRAEDWDLSNPLKTCRLTVDRMDQSCWIQLFVDAWTPLPTTTTDAPTDRHPSASTTGVRKVESSLFCRSIITVAPTDDNNNTINDTTTTSKVRHMVEPVVDSSRYFVVKIQNTTATSTNNNNNSSKNHTASRTAHIGLGFRERDDASNFILALQDYEKSRHREFQANKMLEQYEREQQQQQGLASEGLGELERDITAAATTATPLISKLTLKEGETIHIKLKGLAGSATKEHKKATSNSSSGTSSGVGGTTIPLLKKKPPILLKPPPPPPPAANVEDGKIDSTQGDDDEDEWTDFQES